MIRVERSRKRGSVAASKVRKLSKSSVPIFCDTTIARIVKRFAPPKTRLTSGAKQLMGAILQAEAVDFAEKTYAVSKFARGAHGRVIVMRKDAELVSRLEDDDTDETIDVFGEMMETLGQKKTKKSKKIV